MTEFIVISKFSDKDDSPLLPSSVLLLTLSSSVANIDSSPSLMVNW